MRKGILSVLFVVFITATGAQAREKQLTGSIEVVYLSKWISKGVTVWGQQGGFFEALDLNLWDTGFGTYVVHRHPTAGYSNRERLDYGVYYKNKLFEDTSYQTNYKFRWAYEHYPNIARNRFATTNEWRFSFSWPKLLGSGLVPQYVLWYEYPAGSGYANRDITGWIHMFELRYPVSASVLSPEFGDRKINLVGQLYYNDGLGRNKDHDWSHFTFGGSTKFKLSDTTSLIPALYYQISMDDSVATRDQLYGTVAFRYAF